MATKCELPKNNAVVDTHTDKENEFFNAERAGFKERDEFAKFWQYGDKQKPTEFKWQTDEAESKFELSENKDFSDSVVYNVKGNKTEIDNLKTGTEYYWRVNGCEPYTFRTECGVRFINYEGGANVRDLGGYRTASGKKVKQGMIFRGRAFDDGAGNIFITENGKRTLLEELKIKTDLDLREDGKYYEDGVLAGKGVGFLNYSLEYYVNCLKCSKSQIRAIFQIIFAKEERYPIYMHCQGGMDRTGVIASILLCLLGVSEEEILTDYELTTCGGIGLPYRFSESEPAFAPYWRMIKDFKGNTLSEKVTYYLTQECRIPHSALEKIKDIMLSD